MSWSILKAFFSDIFKDHYIERKNEVKKIIQFSIRNVLSEFLSCCFKRVKKPAHEILNEIIFVSNPVSKFPCQLSLPTPGSLSFPRIPTLASLEETNNRSF